MSDPQPVHVGEILRGIREADHNGFYETWRKVNQLPPKKTTAASNQFSNRLAVSVFYTEAIDVSYPILKLASPCFTPDDRENVFHEPIAFNGATPDASTGADQIAIVQGPIGADRKGHGVISGATFVEIEWTDESHEFAAVKAGDNEKLKSASSGIRVIWHEEIPDEEYLPITLKAVVLLGGGAGGGSFGFRLGRVLTGGISKATGNLTSEAGSGSVNFLTEDTREEVDDPQTVSNATYVGYPEGSIIADFGNGLILGVCFPAPFGWWDEES